MSLRALFSTTAIGGAWGVAALALRDRVDPPYRIVDLCVNHSSASLSAWQPVADVPMRFGPKYNSDLFPTDRRVKSDFVQTVPNAMIDALHEIGGRISIDDSHDTAQILASRVPPDTDQLIIRHHFGCEYHPRTFFGLGFLVDRNIKTTFISPFRYVKTVEPMSRPREEEGEQTIKHVSIVSAPRDAKPGELVLALPEFGGEKVFKETFNAALPKMTKIVSISLGDLSEPALIFWMGRTLATRGGDTSVVLVKNHSR